MTTYQELLNIGDHLRFALFGLECALSSEFNPAEVERLFADAAGDSASSSAKHYAFKDARGLTVTGDVDDYEPGTVRLRVETRRPLKPPLAEIVERAQYQAHRMRRNQDTEP